MALLWVLRVVGLPSLLRVLGVLWVLGVVALRRALLLRRWASLRSYSSSRQSAFTELSPETHMDVHEEHYNRPANPFRAFSLPHTESKTFLWYRAAQVPWANI